MKILITCDPHLPVPPVLYGGIERIVDMLIVNLRKRGHVVGLVAHPESTVKSDYFAPWPCVLPKSAGGHVQNALALRRSVTRFQPTVLHSFSRLAYMLPLLSSSLGKIMSYQRATGGRQIRIAANLAGRSLVFTGCSNFIAAMGRAAGGAWQAIPNFVDTDYYEYASEVTKDAPLAFLSRIESIKGAHLAIEVAKKTGRKLLLAGNYATEGRDAEYWRDVIQPELGSNGIEYVGPVDDAKKSELLRHAAAMIVPVQWDEPFGIVFAEALACGTPVISCPRGALPEIVRDGIDGFLVSSMEDACRAIENLHSIDRHACRVRAEQNFSVGAIVPRYEALYESVAGAT